MRVGEWDYFDREYREELCSCGVLALLARYLQAPIEPGEPGEPGKI